MEDASDKTLREAVRQSLHHWSEKLSCGNDVEKQYYFKNKFIKTLATSPIASTPEKANEQHYELPSEFFQTVLGKRLKYSGCIFGPGVNNLDEAETHTLAVYCSRAQLKDGHHVMDLGCGWGSLGLYILENYPRCTVTCVSNSTTQKKYIEAACGPYQNRLTVITADANIFSTTDRFDRIMTIEMFEHMKNYNALFKKVSSWLKPDGMLFIQTFCHRQFPYAFNIKEGSDSEWMAKNFFTGGIMPSADLYLYFQEDLLIDDQWAINGTHYATTLECWLAKLTQNKARVVEILESAYGQAAKQHLFNWRLFFIFCAEVFGYNQGNEWHVINHLFRKHPKCSL